MRKQATQLGGGLIAIGFLTALCFQLRLNLAPTGFLCLLVIVVQALTGGFFSAAVVSLFAVGALEYFFTPPVLSVRIADPLDALVLVTYLITALVISRLSSKAQEQARNAERNEKEMRLLYEAALQLLAVDPEVAEGRLLSVFRKVFGLSAACIFDSETAKLRTIGASAENLGERTRSSGLRDADIDNEESLVFVRCFRTSGAVTGAVGFEGAPLSSSVAGSLSVVAAMILERARSFKMRAEAAAATEVEALRSAILDALAHEFKGPLSTTLVATDGLVEAGPLNDKQRELAELIEVQISRLDRLTGRLLRTAQLDKTEIRPQLELTDLAQVVTETVSVYRSDFIRVAPTVTIPREPVEVVADRELLNLALVQLIDNAFKYAHSGSAVAIEVNSKEGVAAVRVQNCGSSIPDDERERVFERFYRGRNSGERAAGSGLGLFVSRKIVAAHGGSLELEPKQALEETTTFCLRLNLAKTGSPGVRRAG
ncbi:MAG TPA: ATP-binding protein [Bryobacteraceae bacterium]|nr:ATP-binding protein [Bryobacteraceae bacterium]